MFRTGLEAVVEPQASVRNLAADLGCVATGAFCAFRCRRGAIVHGSTLSADSIAQAIDAVPGRRVRLGMNGDAAVV